MAWYKNDNSIQNCLLKLEKVNNLMQTANTPTKFSQPQLDAINVMESVDESNNSIQMLRNKNFVFNALYQSIRATVASYPLSSTDIMNIDIDVNVLLQIFGLKNTVNNAVAMFNQPKSHTEN